MHLVLEITDTKIRAALVNNKINKNMKNFKKIDKNELFNGTIVKDFQEIALAENIVQNGYILDATAFQYALKDALFLFPGVKKCKIILNSSDIISRKSTLPAKNRSILKTVVKSEMTAILGFTRGFVVNYEILSSQKEVDGTLYSVNINAAPLELIESYTNIASKLKVKDLTIHTRSVAIDNLVKASQINKKDISDEPVLLVELTKSFINIDLIENQQTIFSQSTGFDTAEYGEAIETLFSDSLSDNFDDFSFFIEHAGRGDLADAVSPIVQQFLDKIEKVLPIFEQIADGIARMQQFVYARPGGKRVQDIYLYGEFTEIPGLFSYLQKQINIRLTPIISISTASISNDLDDFDAFVLAGIPENAALNLNKPSFVLWHQQKLGKFKHSFLRKTILIPIAGVIAAGLVTPSISNMRLENQIAQLNDTLNDPAYQEKMEAVIENEKQLKENLDRRQAAATLLSQMESATSFEYDIFDQIVTLLPIGAEFKNVEVQYYELKLTATSKEKMAGVEYTEKLQKLDVFQEVTYTGVTKNDDLYTFIITARLKGSEANHETK